MTEQEMCNRLKEIDEERKKLSEERKKYVNSLSAKKEKELLNNRKKYIGKCFVTRHLIDNENGYIKAFKVIDVFDTPNTVASCVALIDGRRYTCWNEYGVQIMTLSLWASNKLRLMYSESEPKMIDFYKEISQEEFEELYRKHQCSIDDKVFS